MSWLLIGVVSLASGLLGSLGMGAGTVLLLYLRVYGGYDQFAAQGINLIFFLPIAVLSLILHAKNKLVSWKAAGLSIAAGLPMVFAGVWIGNFLGTEWLSKLFAVLLFFVGVREVLQKDPDKAKKKENHGQKRIKRKVWHGINAIPPVQNNTGGVNHIMNDSYNPKSKFSKFMAGKGFYIALAICVVGAGTAAWVAVDKTISRIDDSNSQIIEQQAPAASKEPAYGFPDLEEAGKAQNDVKVPSSSSSSATASSSSQAASSEEQKQSEEVAAQPAPQPSSYVLPISGEIFAPYSNGELVKNVTLKEWRTHDGIDIKSDKGTQVKAASDGKVSAVRDDPLWGMTIEILHEDGVTSVYCGLAKDVTVKQGDKVKVGQAIGVIGDIPCEISLDPHLHFAMKSDGKWVDPLKAMGKVVE
ncbi:MULTISPECIES: TSUP family transporter [Anaerotruncus]|uniref:TSUP family transporter n=1 Tax=Anaerotruncus TaxID=244127 RepID=UPI0009AC852A|nr:MULTISPECIES: TSUP family transporter [Anaerotruncus]RGX56091.1 hypothetical protein DWV16_05265 [Anaerotruncus sp. AF02-27]